MTQLDLFENLTQWVWNVHMSLEWKNWFCNDEKNTENCSRKQCEYSVNKNMYLEQVWAVAYNLVLKLIM